MSEQFPKIKECGLEVYRSDFLNVYVRADALEKLLSQGVVVYGKPDAIIDHTGVGKACFYGSNDHLATHTALLINVKPIVKPDTAESLLREIVDDHSRLKDFEGKPVTWEPLKRRQSVAGES
jgi:hypothetical protein